MTRDVTATVQLSANHRAGSAERSGRVPAADRPGGGSDSRGDGSAPCQGRGLSWDDGYKTRV